MELCTYQLWHQDSCLVLVCTLWPLGPEAVVVLCVRGEGKGEGGGEERGRKEGGKERGRGRGRGEMQRGRGREERERERERGVKGIAPVQ